MAAPAVVIETGRQPDEISTKNPPRFLFFTGKGGVGKTSIACATAVRNIDRI